MPKLSVNIDHVATVRQARRTWEPDLVAAAQHAELGGADGITMHLREDRRHVQDGDLERVRDGIHIPLHFEMAATQEMVSIALRIRPQSAMIVPEGRREITTEGGLDVVAHFDSLSRVVAQLRAAAIETSLFIDADAHQVAAAARLGVEICEIHTGPYAHAFHSEGSLGAQTKVELAKVAQAGAQVRAAGMRFNAGHALHYENVAHVAALDGVHELHIGHAIVSRAIISGLRAAVAEMKSCCASG